MPLCLLCPVGQQPTFAEVGELANHISQIHSKASTNGVAHSPSTRCCVCNKSFTTPGGLLSHQNAKDHLLPCSQCSRKFASSEKLAWHQCEARASSSFTVEKNDVIPNEPTVVEQRTTHHCKECKAHFDSLAELESHEYSHRKFPCSKCRLLFSSLIEWNDHFKQEHQKPIKCSGCKADFASDALLASHGSSCPAIARPASAQSQPNKPLPPDPQRKSLLVCEHCKKEFKVQEGLQAHVAAKHPSGVKCVICHLVCSSSAALEKHVDTVHTCTVCHDGILRDAQTLSDHMSEHTHPIPCKRCGTRYRTEEERMLHFAAADNYHPVCLDCQIGFDDEDASHAHMRLVHPSPKPSPKPSSRPSPRPSPKPSSRRSSPPLGVEAHVAPECRPFFQCDVCHAACSSQTELDVHIVTVHSCPICHDGIYIDTRALEQHLEQHRNPYGCPVCGLAYAEEEQLLQHYKETPGDIHPHCDKCDIGFENHDAYSLHVEEVHPRIACDTCDGALFDQDELPVHYLSSRNHPKCDKCGISFRDQCDFIDHGASVHPECHCYMCQWHFDTPEVLQNHIRHFFNHPKCQDCNIRFADADAYQHHLFVTHRPSFGDHQHMDVSSVEEDHEDQMSPAEPPSPPPGARAVDPLWGFEASASLPYASFIPLPPSLSGYSSPTSQRVTIESPVQYGSLGSHSRSSTLSVEQRSPMDGQPWGATARALSLDVEQPLKPASEFDHSPLSMIPLVGSPPPVSSGELTQSTDSPFSPRPDSQPLFSLSQGIVNTVAMHDDDESESNSSFRRSPPLISPVVKLPDPAAASPSSTTSGWTMTSDTEPKRSFYNSASSSKATRGSYSVGHTASSTHTSVPQLSLLVPNVLNSASNSGCPSSISPESAGISVSATMTPEYIREARAYLPFTHQRDDPPSPTISRSPAISSPILSSTGLALGEHGHRREVRFEENIMTESAWDRQSTSSDSSLDPPVVLPRPALGNFRVNGISKLPRFSALKRTARTNGHANHLLPHLHNRRSNGVPPPSYHCRSCYKDHCEEPTTTTCGHLFCYDCISTAVIKDSRCPVCQAPTLLYCLFRIDTSA